jgi:hypothetical protein
MKSNITLMGKLIILSLYLALVRCSEKAVELPAPEAGQTDKPALKSATVNYYVATNGSDSNLGTSASPFKTIQKAANVVNAGDVVIVRDGTYTTTASNLCDLSRSGVAGSYITFRAENTGGVILDGQSNLRAKGFNLQPNIKYIKIEGFEIKGFSLTGIYLGDTNQASPPVPVNPCQYIEIRDCHIHDIGRYCTDTAAESPTGILCFHTQHILIERNIFNNIGRYENGENGCTNSTNNYKNHDHALYLNGVSYLTAQYNIFYSIKRGQSIHLYSYNDTPSDHVYIYNNTFHDGNPYPGYLAGFIQVWNNVASSVIANNIFHSMADYAINIQAGYSYSLTLQNNITYGGRNVLNCGTTSGVTLSGNQNGVDPLFSNPSVHDFTLQSNSSAIDKGTNVNLTADYLKKVIIGLPDIGAIEYTQGQVTVPPSPTVYYNTQTSDTATKNDCGTGYTGSTVTYTIAAGKYSSMISQSDADNKAATDLSTNKQSYANANGTCTALTVYYNVQQSGTATKNDCGTGYTGTTVAYTIAAGKYSSTISQTDVNQKAINDVNTNKQAYANANGTCTAVPPIVYYNVKQSGTATKNDCGTGYTGTTVTYTVAAGTYTSTVSQTDANNLAIADVNNNKQAYANANGTCNASTVSVTTFKRSKKWWQR